MKRTKCSYVYVATGQWGTKIGMASDPHDRASTLQAGLCHYWIRPNDARQVENAAHKAMGRPPVHGEEWFDVEAEFAIATVRGVIRDFDAQHESNRRHVGYVCHARGGTSRAAQVVALLAHGVAEKDLFIEADGSAEWAWKYAIMALRSKQDMLIADCRCLGETDEIKQAKVRDVEARGCIIREVAPPDWIGTRAITTKSR